MLASLGVGAGLGLLGVDPAGALIAAVALAAGVRDRQVLTFGAIVLVGTIGFGVLVSFTLGERLARLDWAALLPHGALRAGLEAGAALVLAVWAGLRLRGGDGASEPRSMGAGWAAAVATGVLFIGTAATDPSFAALVVLAGRDGSIAGVVTANAVWTLISQAPLWIVIGAVLTGRHHTAVAGLRRLRTRWAPRVRAAVTVSLGLAALVLLLDVAAWALGGFLVGS